MTGSTPARGAGRAAFRRSYVMWTWCKYFD